jgi:hypothetical protein
MKQFARILVVTIALGLLAGLPGAAEENSATWQAQSAAIAAARQRPVTLGDEPLTIQVWQSPEDDQFKVWVPIITGRVIGATRRGDAIKVVISKGGQELKTLRRQLQGNGTGAIEDFNFDADDANAISAHGDLTFTFKYYNDQDESERVIGTRTVKVVRCAQHMGSFKHVWKFGILSDDLAGSSYINLQQEDQYSIPRVWIFFWANRPNGYPEDVSVRVEVNGQRLQLPDDAFSTFGDIAGIDQQEELYLRNVDGNSVQNDYNWYKFRFAPMLYWGPKRTDVSENMTALIDHPGQWVVKFRSQGKLMRELRFTVTPDGLIATHPEQDPAKPGAINYGPMRFFCETYFGNPNEFDARFNPNAIKAGVMWGRPWISDEVKNGMLKNLPPAIPGARPFPTAALPR